MRSRRDRTPDPSAILCNVVTQLGSFLLQSCPYIHFFSPIFASFILNPPFMLRIILFLAFFSITSTLAQGQILNMEKLRLEQDTAKNLLSKTTIGLTANNGSGAEDEPAHVFAFSSEVNLMYYPGLHAHILVSKVDYLRVNDEGVMNFGYLHARSNFLRERQFN